MSQQTQQVSNNSPETGIDWGAVLVALGCGIVIAAKSSESLFFASLGLPFFLTMAAAGWWANYGVYKYHVTKRIKEIKKGDFNGLYLIWGLAFFAGLALLGITYQKISDTTILFFQLFSTNFATIFAYISPFLIWPIVILTVFYSAAMMLDRLAGLWKAIKDRDTIKRFFSRIFTKERNEYTKSRSLKVFAITVFVLGLALVGCGTAFTVLAWGKSLGSVLGGIFNLSVPTYTWLGIIFGSIIVGIARIPLVFHRGSQLFIVLAHPIESSKKIVASIKNGKKWSIKEIIDVLAKMLNIVGNAFIAVNFASALWVQILAGIGAGVVSAAFVLHELCERVVNELFPKEKCPIKFNLPPIPSMGTIRLDSVSLQPNSGSPLERIAVYENTMDKLLPTTCANTV